VQARSINNFVIHTPLAAEAWDWRYIDAYRVVGAAPTTLCAVIPGPAATLAAPHQAG
jgi:hypothetical protein